jgi:hypothetical protein
MGQQPQNRPLAEQIAAVEDSLNGCEKNLQKKNAMST